MYGNANTKKKNENGLCQLLVKLVRHRIYRVIKSNKNRKSIQKKNLLIRYASREFIIKLEANDKNIRFVILR